MRIPVPVGLQQVFVGRRESPTGVTFFGQDINEDNVQVIVEPQGSPDPIRQSMFAGIGRAPTERYAAVNVALHMNIGGINGVMEDGFLAGKVRPGRMSFLANGLGGQAAWTDRQNIQRGEAAPYGNRVEIRSIDQIPYPPVEGYDILYSGRRRY